MENFEQLLNEYDSKIKVGEVKKGTVLAVKDNEVVVNIGYKHDGLISRNNFTKDPNVSLEDLVKIGDEIEAKVIKVNDGEGNVILGIRRAREVQKSELLEKAFQNKEAVTSVVKEAVEKGLITEVDGVRVFIPQSRVNTGFEKDLKKYEGKEVTFFIAEYDPEKNKVIGDRRTYVEGEREATLQAVLDALHEGDVVDGIVKNILPYGAFVEIGGVDGLLPREEYGWIRGKNDLKSGDTVRVFVKSINLEKKQFSLSRKFPDENPWNNILDRYQVGASVTGKVARFIASGAFVNLEEGIDGYVHISQISNTRVEKCEDVLTKGQEVTAKITRIDVENQRISLSIRDLMEKPERRPRRNEKKEDSLINADGFLNIAAATEKVAEIEATEAKKAEEEAKKAEEEAKKAEEEAKKAEEVTVPEENA